MSVLPADKSQRVEMLLDMLKERDTIYQLRNALKEYELELPNRIMDPGQCIPCVLHHNNRATEKLVKELLLIGLNAAPKMEEFIANVEDTVNVKILCRTIRRVNDKAGWKVQLTKDRNNLDKVNLSNTQARLFIDNLGALIEVCTTSCGEEMRSNWLQIADLFKEIADLLDSKKKFSFDEVCNFQRKADELCCLYFAETGWDGMTNYWHLLYAGHYAYFLNKYGNLYRYSQQGWENLNSILKRTFHQNTAKGGTRGGTSKQLPVFYRILRRFMWSNGHLDGLFKHLGFDRDEMEMKYGKVCKQPKFSVGVVEEMEAYANMLYTFAGNAQVDDEFIELDDGFFHNGDSDMVKIIYLFPQHNCQLSYLCIELVVQSRLVTRSPSPRYD